MAINIIRKTLVGKLFRFFPKHTLFVIVGVRKSIYSDGDLEMLVARYYEKSNAAEVYAWYGYSQHSVYWENRSPKEHIRKCLKTHPDKIKYHLGKSIDFTSLTVHDNRISKEYAKYIETIS